MPPNPHPTAASWRRPCGRWSAMAAAATVLCLVSVAARAASPSVPATPACGGRLSSAACSAPSDETVTTARSADADPLRAHGAAAGLRQIAVYVADRWTTVQAAVADARERLQWRARVHPGHAASPWTSGRLDAAGRRAMVATDAGDLRLGLGLDAARGIDVGFWIARDDQRAGDGWGLAFGVGGPGADAAVGQAVPRGQPALDVGLRFDYRRAF